MDFYKIANINMFKITVYETYIYIPGTCYVITKSTASGFITVLFTTITASLTSVIIVMVNGQEQQIVRF